MWRPVSFIDNENCTWKSDLIESKGSWGQAPDVLYSLCIWHNTMGLPYSSSLSSQRSIKSSLPSFPGSPEHELYMRGEPGIFSHVINVIKMGPEILEQKDNVLRVIQPALHSTLGVYDIRSPIAIYV